MADTKRMAGEPMFPQGLITWLKTKIATRDTTRVFDRIKDLFNSFELWYTPLVFEFGVHTNFTLNIVYQPDIKMFNNYMSFIWEWYIMHPTDPDIKTFFGQSGYLTMLQMAFDEYVSAVRAIRAINKSAKTLCQVDWTVICEAIDETVSAYAESTSLNWYISVRPTDRTYTAGQLVNIGNEDIESLLRMDIVFCDIRQTAPMEP